MKRIYVLGRAKKIKIKKEPGSWILLQLVYPNALIGGELKLCARDFGYALLIGSNGQA